MKENNVVSRDRRWLRMSFQVVKESLGVGGQHVGRDRIKWRNGHVKVWKKLLAGGTASCQGWEVGDVRSDQIRGLCSWKTVSEKEAGRNWGQGQDRVWSRMVSVLTSFSVLKGESRRSVWRKVTVWCESYNAHTGFSVENKTGCSVPRAEAENSGRSLSCLFLLLPVYHLPSSVAICSRADCSGLSGSPTAWLRETFSSSESCLLFPHHVFLSFGTQSNLPKHHVSQAGVPSPTCSILPRPEVVAYSNSARSLAN